MDGIYLDNAATTAPRPEAVRAFIDACAEYGNPSSLHRAGIVAKEALEKAREKVSSAIGCKSEELIFTSGGSESNNQAIFAAAKLRGRRAKRIIVSEGEHPSVVNAAAQLAESGFEVVGVPTRGGRLDIDFLAEALKTPTALVCVMLANNETGAVYDIAAVRSAITRAKSEAIFHCDAVQGFLKTPEHTLIKKFCDSASYSAHKVGGVKGVGALYIKSGFRSAPYIFGGGQERGLRSGTENLPGISAFAAACEAFDKAEYERFDELNRFTAEKLGASCADIRLHLPERRGGAILSVSVPGVRSEVMLNALSAEGIYVSAGSACSAARKGTSRVLEAYGLPREELESALRISFSHDNTKEECAFAAERIAANALKLRK